MIGIVASVVIYIVTRELRETLTRTNSSNAPAAKGKNMNIEHSTSYNQSARGYRNNNPLNLRLSSNRWKGKVPASENTDGAFEQFTTMAYGFRAALKNLQSYIDKYHCDTIQSIVTKWVPASDATTYATTALSQFTGQNNKLLTDDLGCEWFMYTGSNKETSREFCIQLTAKKFIHKSEIPTILTGRIDDYQCAIYEKTGLPYGMIEGTTADNFQCNCGGWNCRHQLVPIADALVPASLRAKFAKGKQQVAENPTGYLSQKKGSEAFYTLMDKTGATKEYINDAINQMAWFGVKFEFSEEMTASQIKRTFEDACLKMQKNTDAYYQLSDNIKSLESTLRQLFPNKYGDILQESNIACNLATLKHNGYSKTKERLSKIYKRMDGIVNRYADIGSQKNQYNRRKIEQAAEKLGVKLEDSMSFTQANSGHVNPLDERMNCQRCAVTFEMRMRGLNVAAKWRPEKDDPFFDRKKYGEDAYLSANIWSNTRTGEAPIKHFVLKDTYEKSLSAFNTATQNSGRYILYVYWNAGWSHVVNFIRNKRGKGFFYDGQICTYNTFEYYYTECNKKVANALVVWRVDDCDLDKSLINKGTFLIINE